MDNLLIASIQMREHRKSKKMNQEQLAEASGTSRSLISLIESNKIQNVTFSSLERIFKALDVQLTMNYTPLRK